jgi:hypothetical protein
MKLIAALAFLLQASPSSPQPTDHCPILPADSALTWTYQQGPDFGVCYAVDSATKKDAFGIYLGFAPSFHPESAKTIGRGNVGGHRIKWYARDPSNDPSEFSRETLVRLDRQGSVAHVWVTAESQQQLASDLRFLVGCTSDDSYPVQQFIQDDTASWLVWGFELR